jgi:hypothetical protein
MTARREHALRRNIFLLLAPLLGCTIATNALAAELKKPGPSPSDALFDPSRVVHPRKLMAALQEPEPVSLPHLDALVDLDSFIKMWAAEVLIGCPDSYAGNRNNI